MLVDVKDLEKSLLQTKMLLSKSDDELSVDNSDTNNESLLHTKHISNSTGSLNIPTLRNYKEKRRAMLMRFVNIKEEQLDNSYHNYIMDEPSKSFQENSYTDDSMRSKSDGNISLQEHFNIEESEQDDNTVRLSRQMSEPPDMYSSQTTLHETSENQLVKQNLRPTLRTIDGISSSKGSNDNTNTSEHTEAESNTDNACNISPIVKNRLWNVYVAHTSTPSNLLRKSLVNNDYMLTPITNNDKSMSPITQSATKMTKAMQVCTFLILEK